jgi:predicted PurR-regulated permease PerM
MAVFAILPIVGMTLVWVPAAIVLMLDGEFTHAFILVLAFIALTVADSIYYPHLVGNRMKLHTAIAFIAAIGGILLFGPMGFILGPLAVTLTLALKDILKVRSLVALAPPMQ